MTYLGDEGRDMLIVLNIVRGINFPLIGPPTSVGELYLGPIYYYFITPFALLFGMNPVGPAIFVVILGIAAIPLIYLVGKKMFNTQTGIVVALFYALSPLAVEFSRSSWNPNPMPFFVLLLILFLYELHKTKKVIFLYLSVMAFATMLQLHYLALLLTPWVIFIVWQLRGKLKKKNLIAACLLLFILMSPLLIFDLKHNFINSRGMLAIFQGRSEEGFSFIDLLSRSRDRIRQLLSLFFGFNERDWRTNVVSLGVVIFVVIDVFRKKSFIKLLVYGWFIWGIIAVGLYRHSFYPHYLGFLFPLPALAVGLVVSKLSNRSKYYKLAGYLAVALLSLNMLSTTWAQLSRPPVLNVKLVQKIVRLITSESEDKQFNFALLARQNYDDSYRYFFKLWNIPATYSNEVSKQLFVVCEDEDICKPQGNPKWEIALFDAAYNGKIKIAGEWQPDPIIKVFKFVPQNE
jgi:4-amino-4-deoxy-L-arabinose transferase-like glycosyltransferase